MSQPMSDLRECPTCAKPKPTTQFKGDECAACYASDAVGKRKREERRKQRHAERREAVFGHYGRVCACCGSTDRLAIDHVAGGGSEHRIALFGRESECPRFYQWLIKQGFPDGFQTLCRPCNSSKGSGAYCRLHPPQEKTNWYIDNRTNTGEDGPMTTPEFTDMLPGDLPGAADLIAELRAADPDDRPAIIGRYPSLGLLAPVPVLAAWLGMKEGSIYAARTAGRWPDADATVLGRKMWRFSTAALVQAATRRGAHLTAEARAERAGGIR